MTGLGWRRAAPSFRQPPEEALGGIIELVVGGPHRDQSGCGDRVVLVAPSYLSQSASRPRAQSFGRAHLALVIIARGTLECTRKQLEVGRRI